MAFDGKQVAAPGLVANSDLSGKQFYFVKLVGTNLVDVCSAVTDIPCGVLQDTPKAGQPANVCSFGVTKLITGAAISAGAVLGTTNAGKAAAYVAGTDTTKYLVGQALTSTGAANGILTAFVNCVNPARGA